MDTLRNDDISNKMYISPCIEYIFEFAIKSQQIQWFGHFLKIEHNRLHTNAYNKTRSTGRPRKKKQIISKTF